MNKLIVNCVIHNNDLELIDAIKKLLKDPYPDERACYVNIRLRTPN